MPRRLAKPIAWSLWLLPLACWVAALSLRFTYGLAPLGSAAEHRAGAFETPYQVLVAATFLGIPTLGLLVATRRPTSYFGWLFLLAGLFVALPVVLHAYVQAAAYVAGGGLTRLRDPGGVVRELGGPACLRPARPAVRPVPHRPSAVSALAPGSSGSSGDDGHAGIAEHGLQTGPAAGLRRTGDREPTGDRGRRGLLCGGPAGGTRVSGHRHAGRGIVAGRAAAVGQERRASAGQVGGVRRRHLCAGTRDQRL